MSSGHTRRSASQIASAPACMRCNRDCQSRDRRKLRQSPHPLRQDWADNRFMSRYFAICYGAVAYLLFLVSFVYAIGFVGNIWVPRSVDHALSAPVGQAVLIDVALLGVFA